MFDSPTSSQNSGSRGPSSAAPAPAAAQQSVEDILSSVDTSAPVAPTPVAPRTIVPPPPTPPPPAAPPSDEALPEIIDPWFKRHRLLLATIAATIVVSGGAGYGTWLYLKSQATTVPLASSNQPQIPAEPVDSSILPDTDSIVTPTPSTDTPIPTNPVVPTPDPTTPVITAPANPSVTPGGTTSEPTPTPTMPTPTVPKPVAGLDSDSDNLSDLEEGILGTNTLNADTDRDGYSDGDETRNLYSPSSASKRLVDDPAITFYADSDLKFSFLFPRSWSVAKREGQWVVAATAGDTITVAVRENPQRTALQTWYAQEFGKPQAQTMSFAANRTVAISSDDGMAMYVADASAPQRIFILSYVLGPDQQSINFKTMLYVMAASLRPSPR